jgi:hypothetical protein
MVIQMHLFKGGPGKREWSTWEHLHGPAERRTNKGLVQVVHVVHVILIKLLALYTRLFTSGFSQFYQKVSVYAPGN